MTKEKKNKNRNQRKKNALKTNKAEFKAPPKI